MTSSSGYLSIAMSLACQCATESAHLKHGPFPLAYRHGAMLSYEISYDGTDPSHRRSCDERRPRHDQEPRLSRAYLLRPGQDAPDCRAALRRHRPEIPGSVRRV